MKLRTVRGRAILAGSLAMVSFMIIFMACSYFGIGSSDESGWTAAWHSALVVAAIYAGGALEIWIVVRVLAWIDPWGDK